MDDDDDDGGGGVIGNNVGGGTAISSCLLIICIRIARRDDRGDVCVRGTGATITDWGCPVNWKNQSLWFSDDGIIAWHIAKTFDCIGCGVAFDIGDDNWDDNDEDDDDDVQCGGDGMIVVYSCCTKELRNTNRLYLRLFRIRKKKTNL